MNVRRGRHRRRAALLPGLDAGRLRDQQLRPLGHRTSPRPPAGKPLDWDKLDYDTWRIRARGRARGHGARSTTWPTRSTTRWPGASPTSRSFNGTNLFPYPEGRGFEFPASVTVKTQPGWLVATGMEPAGAAAHLARVELPRPGGQAVLHRPVRRRQRAGGRPLAPARRPIPRDAMAGPARSLLWDQIGKMVPAMAAVFRRPRGARTPR